MARQGKFWFFCPYCGRRISAPAKLFGKVVRCPACRTKLSLPSSYPHNPEPARRPKRLLRRKTSSQQKPPIIVERPEETDQPAIRPRAKGRRRSAPPHPSSRPVTPASFRVRGEIELLGLALFLATVLSIFTMGLVLLLLVLAVIRIKSTERRERQTSTPVTPTTFPELHQISVQAAKRLEMHLPPIYLMEVDAVNAHALGFMSEGSVILYRGLVHQMTTAELQFIIGHELAHIKCGHTSWLALTHSTSSAMAGHKLYLIFHLLFRAWSRKCEFTCDRGGLLACVNPQIAARALARLEVPDPTQAEWLVQRIATNREPAPDSLEDLVSTHPRTRKRIRAVIDFSRTQTYRDLTSRTHAMASIRTPTS